MSLIQWGPEFITGIDEVDFQHLKLVNMINSLYKLKDIPSGNDKDLSIKVILEQVLDYTAYHFTAEEKLMQDARYEHLKSHQNAHEKLKLSAVEFYQSLEKGEDVFNDLMLFLKDWLTEHILKVDKQYITSVMTLKN